MGSACRKPGKNCNTPSVKNLGLSVGISILLLGRLATKKLLLRHFMLIKPLVHHLIRVYKYTYYLVSCAVKLIANTIKLFYRGCYWQISRKLLKKHYRNKATELMTINDTKQVHMMLQPNFLCAFLSVWYSHRLLKWFDIVLNFRVQLKPAFFKLTFLSKKLQNLEFFN